MPTVRPPLMPIPTVRGSCKQPSDQPAAAAAVHRTLIHIIPWTIIPYLLNLPDKWCHGMGSVFLSFISGFFLSFVLSFSRSFIHSLVHSFIPSFPRSLISLFFGSFFHSAIQSPSLSEIE
jgi:RsiW-degrading membrane proteinase PrsW (M82 family)